MENECEALPGVAYPGVRDNRSTLNTKTGYDDDDTTSWRRSIVVRTLVSAGELSLSCARLLAGWVTTLWSSRPLSVSQHGQLSHPALTGR